MEWRCPDCGKPHASDDPPCDNCGHHEFERAVVPAAEEGGPTVWVCTECGREHPRNSPPCSRCGAMDLRRREQRLGDDADLLEGAPSGGGGSRGPPDGRTGEAAAGEPDEDAPEATMTAWVCTECGKTHPRNSPPCNRCGNMTLERREKRYGEDDLLPDEPEATAADRGPVSETTTVWACTECGKAHPRNSPPCNRCGNMTLERRERTFEEVRGTTWRDAVDLRMALGFVLTVVLAAFVAGTSLGLVNVPGTTIGGPPAVADVPGDATSAGELSLADVEAAYVTELNDRRTADGRPALERNDRVAAVAAFYNQRRVKAEYADGTVPSDRELSESLGEACSGPVALSSFRYPGGLSTFDSPEAAAGALVGAHLSDTGGFEDLSDQLVGVDVHVAPDGVVYVTQFAC